MATVSSASRRLRKTGAVPVLGLTRAKSAAASGKRRSGSSLSATACRKKAQRAGAGAGARPATKAQNLKRPSTSGKNGGALWRVRRFSKS